MGFDLTALDGASFDVVVIGGGSVGIGSALAFAEAGKKILMAERGDFGSGTTSRSSRVVNSGLLYMAPNNATMWQLLGRPRQMAAGFREAARFMKARSEFARNYPHLTRTATACYPVYRSGTYRGWQVDLAFKLLRLFDIGGYPLNYRRLSKKDAMKLPLLEWLRDDGDLDSVAIYDEVIADWPERLMYESVVKARALGATALNYTSVTRSEQAKDGSWLVELRSETTGQTCQVKAQSLVNASGPWIDHVNGVLGDGAQRAVVLSKGTHIVVRLPEACRDFGVVTTDKNGKPMTFLPFRGLHVIGSTWDSYTGHPDAVRPDEKDVDYLIAQANFILPGEKLAREDVIYAWAGLRSLAFDPDMPAGRRGFFLHDFDKRGLPHVVAVTGSPVTTYIDAGQRVLRAVLGLPPTSVPPASTEGSSMKVLAGAGPEQWAHVARTEDVETLVDLLFRRTGQGWDADLGRARVEEAARSAGEALGWSEAKTRDELARFDAYVRHNHIVDRPQE